MSARSKSLSTPDVPRENKSSKEALRAQMKISFAKKSSMNFPLSKAPKNRPKRLKTEYAPLFLCRTPCYIRTPHRMYIVAENITYLISDANVSAFLILILMLNRKPASPMSASGGASISTTKNAAQGSGTAILRLISGSSRAKMYSPDIFAGSAADIFRSLFRTV